MAIFPYIARFFRPVLPIDELRESAQGCAKLQQYEVQKRYKTLQPRLGSTLWSWRSTSLPSPLPQEHSLVGRENRRKLETGEFEDAAPVTFELKDKFQSAPPVRGATAASCHPCRPRGSGIFSANLRVGSASADSEASFWMSKSWNRSTYKEREPSGVSCIAWGSRCFQF